MKSFWHSVLPVFAGIAAAAVVAFAPAAGATSDQSIMKIPVGAQIDLGSAAPCAAGDLVITVQSGHDHFFTNNTGEWENATVQGTAQLVDPVTGAVLENGGHAEAWFTANDNNRNAVFSAKDSAQFPSGRIQQNMHFTVNANGVPVVSNATANCG
jgi:hypothetical protein